MLRWAVAMLLLANLGFFAWTQGWLDPLVGAPADSEREPERVARQLRPEAVKLLPAPAVAAAAACLEAGPFAEAEAAAAQEALRAAGVPTERWQLTAAGPAQQLLRVERADAALQAQLQRLKAPALGSGFRPCAAGAG